MSKTLKLTATMHFGIRGRFIRTLKKYAFHIDIDLDIEEEKGLINSVFLITAHGSKEAIAPIEEWIKNFEEDKK